jgi:hypothetical protein
MSKRWRYMGDISLEHGGTFFDFSEWKHGYVNVVEVQILTRVADFVAQS